MQIKTVLPKYIEDEDTFNGVIPGPPRWSIDEGGLTSLAARMGWKMGPTSPSWRRRRHAAGNPLQVIAGRRYSNPRSGPGWKRRASGRSSPTCWSETTMDPPEAENVIYLVGLKFERPRTRATRHEHAGPRLRFERYAVAHRCVTGTYRWYP
jgi:hypothetical protein